MDVLMIVLGAILLVLAVALVALVLMQQGKDKKLSGAIAGGSDTFYGKNKTADKDKVMSVITAIVGVVFVVIVIAMYLIA
jgi:preprotein translocase subunit SecG